MQTQTTWKNWQSSLCICTEQKKGIQEAADEMKHTGAALITDLQKEYQLK